MTETALRETLTALATELDAPDGPGGGAICLDALAEIEARGKRLEAIAELAALDDPDQRVMPPARPPDSHP